MDFPILPNELLDLIVDHLHDDKQALLQCSLVKPLLPSARLHLFENTRIELCTKSLLQLIDLLDSPLSSLRPVEGSRSCIRTVSFDDLTKLSYQHGVPEVIQAIRSLNRIFGLHRPNMPHRVGLLPTTKSVSLANTDFERVPQEIVSSLLCCISTTFTHLSLSSLHFYRFYDFVAVVCSFKALETITVDKVAWTHNGRSPSTLPRAPQGIEWNILEVRRGGNLQDLAEWISYGSEAVVKSLHYDAAGVEEASLVHQLLASTTQSIRRLQVSFPVFSDSGRVGDLLQGFINLDDCTSLQALHFKRILLFPGDPVTTMIRPLVPLLLSQLASQAHADSPRFDFGSTRWNAPNTEFRSLSFELMLPTSEDESCLKEFDWDGVVRALSGEQQLISDAVHVSAGTSSCPKTSNPTIITMLPRCQYNRSSSSLSSRVVPPAPPSTPGLSEADEFVEEEGSCYKLSYPAPSSTIPIYPSSPSRTPSPLFPHLAEITFTIQCGPRFDVKEGVKYVMDQMRRGGQGLADIVSVTVPNCAEDGCEPAEALRERV